MDFADKRNCIENITEEVKKFHPLLESVLPKMPNVKAIEYTHGQYERGADFIVQVENATTGRTSYVGVVVKCGKIGSGKVTEVEEQIKECAEERAYQVSKRVRCTEVWVFASGGYSERSKEKLYERLSGRSIEFFGSEDIAKLVDDHFPFFWHDLPHDLGIYLQQLNTKLLVLDQASEVSLSPAVSGLYIELDTYERIKKTYAKTTQSKSEIKNVDVKQEILKTKIGLLEAEMGFGKSKFARHLAISLCGADGYHKHKIIPVFSSFKQYIEVYGGDLDILVRTSLGPSAVCLDDGVTEVLIILDGLDESSCKTVSSTSLFESLLAQAKAFPRYRVLVTSRPLKMLIDKATFYNEARIFDIRPLSLEKVVRYLKDACTLKNLPARLFEDLKRSPLFRQLPQSPIAAALFSNLLAQNQQEVPQSLTELYAKSTELMLGRWEQKKELATEKQFKTAQVIAEQLAEYFIDNRLIYVAMTEVTDTIDSYLSKRNIGISSNEIYELLFERSNLFSIDEDTGTVAFRHRSFAEYLCAHKKSRDKSLSVVETALDPYWVNVFFFYAGTLSDCPEILAELRTLKSANEGQEWMKVLSVPNYLLAAFQTEFSEVESNLIVVLLEAANLYLRVRRGDTKTRLPELTEMQLLYLFKSIVTETLGYEFFNRGFESITLKIDEALEDSDVKAYALFFLGCAALECENDAPFKFLVHDIGTKKLPLPLSFAIQCELNSKTNKEKDGLLKFHREKLKRLLGKSDKGGIVQNADTRGRINDLFDKPLSVRRDRILGVPKGK